MHCLHVSYCHIYIFEGIYCILVFCFKLFQQFKYCSQLCTNCTFISYIKLNNIRRYTDATQKHYGIALKLKFIAVWSLHILTVCLHHRHYMVYTKEHNVCELLWWFLWHLKKQIFLINFVQSNRKIIKPTKIKVVPALYNKICLWFHLN